MNNKTRTLFLFGVALIALSACRKKAFDEFYGRPESLEPPIYQTLAARGNFKTLLAVIDKSGYKQTLSAAGYWTFFAPNDSAFTVYFRENNISGVEKLDSAAARKIVTYSLVYNAFKKDRIDDYQSNLGWQVNSSFRKRTANYTGVYDAVNTNGAPIKAIASNRNGNTLFYVEADQNNKYIPVFTDTFFMGRGLTAADYNYFYPNTPFTGFNVADAAIVTKEIAAENGVVHEVNRVITALPSIDEYLNSNPNYSEFKKLFDKYLVQYVLNQSVTLRYNNQGNPGQVFTKVFNSVLGFSPNNENFLKLQDNDGQTSGYTMFVPRNIELLEYINRVLLQNYTSVDALPIGVIYDFVNAHMFQNTVWPTKFSTTFNVQNEPARFNAATDVIDKKVLSNGMFYGTNKVQEANVFTTVFGRVYLDPKYSKMQQLMSGEIRNVVTNPNQRYTIFMMSDAAIAAAGYIQNPLLNNEPTLQWTYTPTGGGTTIGGAAAYQRLLRILFSSVVFTPNDELDNLQGNGVAQTYGNEYIRYTTGRVYGAGNLDSNNTVGIDSFKTASNGRVYYTNRLIQFSESQIGKHIEKLQFTTGTTRSQYWHFVQYLKNAANYNATTGEILLVTAGANYTIFIPDSNAIKAAVNAGWLPGTGTAPNKVPDFNPTRQTARDSVVSFIQYHILNKIAIGTDGVTSGQYETLFIPGTGPTAGTPTGIFVFNSKGRLELRDNTGANPVRPVLAATRSAPPPLPQPSSNDYLSNRAVIHLIDNYLRY